MMAKCLLISDLSYLLRSQFLKVKAARLLAISPTAAGPARCRLSRSERASEKTCRSHNKDDSDNDLCCFPRVISNNAQRCYSQPGHEQNGHVASHRAPSVM
jgi:hypothetical protein